MSLWDRLKAFLRPDPGAGRIPLAPDYEARLKALEDVQTLREIQWAETRQALDRMLKRAAALDQRAREREEKGSPRNGNATDLLRRIKFPHQEG